MFAKFLPYMLLVTLALAVTAPAREWTNTTGKKIDAEFVSRDATHVRLKRPNGKTLRIAIEQLSQADRDWLAEQADAPAAADTPTGEPEPRNAKPKVAAPAPDDSPGPHDLLTTKLETLGAIVTRDGQQPERPIVGVDLHGLQIMDSTLAELDGLDTLKRLDLSNCYFTTTDAGLAHLATLDNLEELTYYNSNRCSDALLTPLENLAHLKALNLDVAPIRFIPTIHDAGIAHLSQLAQLEKLRISNTEISDKSMQYLSQMTNLRELELVWTSISNSGIATLRRFPHLRKLLVSTDTSINDDGLKLLADLTELESLTLSGNSLSAHVLKHVKSKKLRELELVGYTFGDDAISYVQAMSNLEELHLRSASISDEGLAGLNKLKKLTTLEISQCSVDGTGLKALKGLKQLRTLKFHGYARLPQAMKISPEALDCLGNFPLLETLEFNRTFVGNAGIANIKMAPKLKHVQLASANLNDDGMAPLAALKNLESLHLTFNQATGPGLAHLEKLRKFERLWIPCPVTDEGAAHIAKCKALRELDLTGAKITDKSLPLLAQLGNLEQLSIFGADLVTPHGVQSLTALTKLRGLKLYKNQLDDATVPFLLKMPNLQTLELIQTHITGAGLEQLAGLPKLRRLWVSSPDHNGIRRLQERNAQVLVFDHSEKLLLRGQPW